jgi:transposase-like protein
LVAALRLVLPRWEGLLAERGVEVDHVTVYRWVRTFTSEFIDAARAARHAAGDRWFLDETYVKVAGRWTYRYRAIDLHGQVIGVLVCERRDAAAARAFFTRALKSGPSPVEVTTDRAHGRSGVSEIDGEQGHERGECVLVDPDPARKLQVRPHAVIGDSLRGKCCDDRDTAGGIALHRR